MKRSESIAKLAAAMARAQGKFTDAERDRDNPFFSSTYSTMAAVLAACRKALTEEGIAVFQATENVEGQPDSLKVETLLTLGDTDEWIQSDLVVKVLAMKVEKGDRDAGTAAVKAITAQAMGSAQTYACRIALRSLVVVASEAAEDDDGNAASDVKPAEGKFQDIIVDVRSETKPGQAGKKPWTIHRIETKEHGELSTFDQGWGDQARKLKELGQLLDFEAKKNPKGYGFDLIGVWPIQAQDGQGAQQAPPPSQDPGNGARPAQATSQAKPAAMLETFIDTIEDLNTRNVAGAPPRFGFKTAKNGWVGTSDAKVNERISRLKGSGLPVRFEAFKNNHGGWDLHSAEEVPPAGAADPAATAAPALDLKAGAAAPNA